MTRPHTTDPKSARPGLKKSRTRAGATLLEALIAMSIFAVFTTG